ncbi:hypothetical protein KTJ34_01580 [Acinetobacter courvalinii]|uniref:hypothetical protein n=1 Tax=Acinetobacter courvalinii TaxID=280147 RepID=UPI0021D22A36|nr:hypothetical protein [Acinetobacter courvalinii]MCU4576102.1 hypothetical protein [Acinetobacter courvalinii]
MNFKNFEEKFITNPVIQEQIQANWTQVRFTPDLVTNEQLSIGVLINHEGIVHTKFIEDFSRVECAYGSEIVTYLKSCIELFEDFLHSNFETSFSSQLILDKRGFVQGETIDGLLDELLVRVVPLSLPHHSKSFYKKQFHTVKTVKFHSEVKSYIKNKMGEIYKEIFPRNETLLVGDSSIGFRSLPVAINIEKNNKIGDLVSTVYATPDTVEINCLKALENLRAVKKYAKKDSDCKLFMLSPDNQNMELLSNADKKKRKEIIENFKWSLRSEGISFVEEHSVNEASEKLIEWSGIDRQRRLEEV